MRYFGILAIAYALFAVALPYLILVALRRRRTECARCRVIA